LIKFDNLVSLIFSQSKEPAFGSSQSKEPALISSQSKEPAFFAPAFGASTHSLEHFNLVEKFFTNPEINLDQIFHKCKKLKINKLILDAIKSHQKDFVQLAKKKLQQTPYLIIYRRAFN
jgi:hypothetical protein